ncbi:DUF308 domain-containing protein [Candidatus Saccharibacteria bacterium]|nr:DUF308 domain-containing protein [Candidatus Saccharibacteria bacterium]
MKKFFSILLGVIVALIGIATLFTPVRTLINLTVFIGIAALVGGFFNIFAFALSKNKERSGAILFFGIISVVLGSLILVYTGASAALVLGFFGIWLFVASLARIFEAFHLKKLGSKYWGLDLAVGIILTLFSFWVLWHPLAKLALLDIFVSIALLAVGVSLITSAFITPKKGAKKQK